MLLLLNILIVLLSYALVQVSGVMMLKSSAANVKNSQFVTFNLEYKCHHEARSPRHFDIHQIF